MSGQEKNSRITRIVEKVTYVDSCCEIAAVAEPLDTYVRIRLKRIPEHVDPYPLFMESSRFTVAEVRFNKEEAIALRIACLRLRTKIDRTNLPLFDEYGCVLSTLGHASVSMPANMLSHKWDVHVIVTDDCPEFCTELELRYGNIRFGGWKVPIIETIENTTYCLEDVREDFNRRFASL